MRCFVPVVVEFVVVVLNDDDDDDDDDDSPDNADSDVHIIYKADST